MVELTLTNTKNESKTFLSDSAKFVTESQAAYDPAEAATNIKTDSNLILRQVDPDVETSGTLIYEVPTDAVSGGSLVIEDFFGVTARSAFRWSCR